jgi:hypothetical protein
LIVGGAEDRMVTSGALARTVSGEARTTVAGASSSAFGRAGAGTGGGLGLAQGATGGGGAPFMRTVASTGVTVFAGDTVFSPAKGGGWPGFIWIVGGISLSVP